MTDSLRRHTLDGHGSAAPAADGAGTPAPRLSVAPAVLLPYRPWRGEFHAPAWGVWTVARVALRMMFRRKLFWVLYGLGLMIFLLNFFGQYLLAWAEANAGEQMVQVIGNLRENPRRLVMVLRDQLRLNGTAITHRNFFWYQGYVCMAVLALAGSVVIGNDIRHGSLPFYLSKPLSSWHYLLGKVLAVGVFVNLMTTLPALLLWIQYGLLDRWSYFTDTWHLALGIVGYGLLLTVCLSLILVAAAVWLQRTVPLIMVWSALFIFCRFLAGSLVDFLHYDARWRLFDLWNNLYVVGNVLLGVAAADIRPQPQPDWTEAALVLGGVCAVCLTYLTLRIRGVEIVR